MTALNSLMTWEGFAIWTLFFALVVFVGVLAEAVCKAAAKPTPSPLDRVADYDADDDLDLDWKIGGTD